MDKTMTTTATTPATAHLKAANDQSPYVLSRDDDDNFVAGRRSFLQYRELGVTAASGGKMRCQITQASQGLSEETGWHMHHCDAQFVHMLSGWLDLEFPGGEKIRLSAGDSLLIPGETPHNETGTSETFELLEVSIPAEMGTTPCDRPD